MDKERRPKKKRFRRTASEIERRFPCPHAGCGKAYGCECSLNHHIKLKHRQPAAEAGEQAAPAPAAPFQPPFVALMGSRAGSGPMVPPSPVHLPQSSSLQRSELPPAISLASLETDAVPTAPQGSLLQQQQQQFLQQQAQQRALAEEAEWARVRSQSAVASDMDIFDALIDSPSASSAAMMSASASESDFLAAPPTPPGPLAPPAPRAYAAPELQNDARLEGLAQLMPRNDSYDGLQRNDSVSSLTGLQTDARLEGLAQLMPRNDSFSFNQGLSVSRQSSSHSPLSSHSSQPGDDVMQDALLF